MSDDGLGRYLEDPADDPEAAATIDELITRGRTEFVAIRDMVFNDSLHLTEAVEHIGGLVETIGELKPHLENRGEREQIAKTLIMKTGVSGPVAEILVDIGNGLIRLWRKRRDAKESPGNTRIPSRLQL